MTPGMAKLSRVYQRAMGSGKMMVEAISTENISHRATYAAAVPQ
jgi:hypothetical protein